MKTKTNLLPAHYTKSNEPSFQGRGNHSVGVLEDICEQYQELVHQLRIERQALLDISNGLLSPLSAMVNVFDRSDMLHGTIERMVCNDSKRAIQIAEGATEPIKSETPYDWTTHGDFKKYYDTTQKRNIWVLGYFGGGSINISEAYTLSKQYADAVGVPLENVKIDEILSSRRFKGYKFMYSNDEREMEAGAEQMENVYAWLRA